MIALLVEIPVLDLVTGEETKSRKLFIEGHNILVTLENDNEVEVRKCEDPLKTYGSLVVGKVEVPVELLTTILKYYWAKNELSNKYQAIQGMLDIKTQE